MKNIDAETVDGFGKEWSTYDQAGLADSERAAIFNDYFADFPWGIAGGTAAIGADIGCGSGRWALLVAPRVSILHCVDPSDAIEVARRACAALPNVRFHRASADSLPFEDGSLDFAYSLGVLHHVPDTLGAIQSIARKLKVGAPFLVYLYYAFDNRPAWFRGLWRASDALRRAVARAPFGTRLAVTRVIAASVYWPLARSARALERIGMLPRNFPLAAYRDRSYYTMQTDALDRFGTHLEQRFTRTQIEELLRGAGFGEIAFSNHSPYWCAVARKRG